MLILGADVERRTDHARVTEAHCFVQIVDSRQEVTEATPGCPHHRCVALPRCVPDERATELSEKFVGGPLPVANYHRAGVGNRRYHVVKIATVYFEHAVDRQSRFHKYESPRLISIPVTKLDGDVKTLSRLRGDQLLTGKRRRNPSNFPISAFPDASGHRVTVFGQDRATVALAEGDGVPQTMKCVTAADIQAISHIVFCSLTKLDGGVQHLHTADAIDEASPYRSRIACCTLSSRIPYMALTSRYYVCTALLVLTSVRRSAISHKSTVLRHRQRRSCVICCCVARNTATAEMATNYTKPLRIALFDYVLGPLKRVNFNSIVSRGQFTNLLISPLL